MKFSPALAATLSVLLASGIVWANTEEKGEGKAEMALKHRAKTPQDADIDSNATLQALLDKSGKDAWSDHKAARIEGYVIQVEREPDNDVKVVLATAKGETNTQRWVIAEVCPERRKKDATMSETALRGMVGKKIAVTGWLYREPEEESGDPRGTLWEVHPVTSIKLQ